MNERKKIRLVKFKHFSSLQKLDSQIKKNE